MYFFFVFPSFPIQSVQCVPPSELADELHGWAGAYVMDAASVRSQRDDAVEELHGGGREAELRFLYAMAPSEGRIDLCLV